MGWREYVDAVKSRLGDWAKEMAVVKSMQLMEKSLSALYMNNTMQKTRTQALYDGRDGNMKMQNVNMRQYYQTSSEESTYRGGAYGYGVGRNMNAGSFTATLANQLSQELRSIPQNVAMVLRRGGNSMNKNVSKFQQMQQQQGFRQEANKVRVGQSDMYFKLVDALVEGEEEAMRVRGQQQEEMQQQQMYGGKAYAYNPDPRVNNMQMQQMQMQQQQMHEQKTEQRLKEFRRASFSASLPAVDAFISTFVAGRLFEATSNNLLLQRVFGLWKLASVEGRYEGQLDAQKKAKLENFLSVNLASTAKDCMRAHFGFWKKFTDDSKSDNEKEQLKQTISHLYDRAMKNLSSVAKGLVQKDEKQLLTSVFVGWKEAYLVRKKEEQLAHLNAAEL